MKNKEDSKKKKAKAPVKFPGGVVVICAHVTDLKGGKLVSKNLSRADKRFLVEFMERIK